MALGLTSMNTMAAGNSGEVFFKGEVVDTPCNLAPGEAGQAVQVPFGQLSMAQLNANQQVAQNFTIGLTGCALNGKTAAITFSSDRADAANTLIQTSGTATGLGIGIDGYTFGTEKALNVTDGDNTLRFTAVAKRLAAGTDVTAGNFDAISNFVINYK
ncbi:fimbrial protein [Salmonella enterica subsp. enterica]